MCFSRCDGLLMLKIEEIAPTPTHWWLAASPPLIMKAFPSHPINASLVHGKDVPPKPQYFMKRMQTRDMRRILKHQQDNQQTKVADWSPNSANKYFKQALGLMNQSTSIMTPIAFEQLKTRWMPPMKSSLIKQTIIPIRPVWQLLSMVSFACPFLKKKQIRKIHIEV